MIKLAIFDLDGTVLDSMPKWRHIALELLRERGIPVTEEMEENLPKLAWESAYPVIYNMDKENPIRPEEGFQKMASYYEQGLPLRRGVPEIFRELSRRNIGKVLASATPKELCDTALQKAGVREEFLGIECAPDYPYGKGDPRFFRDVTKKYGVIPEECVLFEDAYYSVKTAKSLGMTVVGTEDFYQFEARDDIEQAADYYFTEGFTVRRK